MYIFNTNHTVEFHNQLIVMPVSTMGILLIIIGTWSVIALLFRQWILSEDDFDGDLTIEESEVWQELKDSSHFKQFLFFLSWPIIIVLAVIMGRNESK